MSSWHWCLSGQLLFRLLSSGTSLPSVLLFSLVSSRLLVYRLLNCIDCADYVLLRTLSDRPDIYLIFFTALVVFYCISCTMDTANIFTVLVVIFFIALVVTPCCSLFRSYFLVVVLLSSVGWVIPKFGWVIPFLAPSATWPISARGRCSTSCLLYTSPSPRD